MPELNPQDGLSPSMAAPLSREMSVSEFLQMVHTNVSAWRRLSAYYRCAMMEVETKFRVLDQQFSIQYDRNPIETIKTRIKSPQSLAQKLIRKGLPLNLSSVEQSIHDMAGVRVICSFLEDIDLLAECLLRQDDVQLVTRKDYIRTPKPNGYRGLHLIVEVPIYLQNEKRMMKVEVQLRTIAMDFWASTEHKLRYKKQIDPSQAALLGQELLACADQAAALDDRMQRLRDQFDAYTPSPDSSFAEFSESLAPLRQASQLPTEPSKAFEGSVEVNWPYAADAGVLRP